MLSFDRCYHFLNTGWFLGSLGAVMETLVRGGQSAAVNTAFSPESAEPVEAPVLKPCVSVVTPAFDSACTLEQTVRSVAAQTLPVKEQIIVDDGSRDDTRELVERLREEFPFLHYVRQRHRGAGWARNLGIEMATGRYIAFLDSDDLWLPDKLARQIGFMENSACLFTYGDYEEYSKQDKRLLRRYQFPDRIRYDDLLVGCPVGCLTAAYDQRQLGKCYMPQARRGQDWALWLKLARLTGGAHKYPGCSAVYHRSSDGLSSGKLRKALDIFNIYRRQEAMPSWAAGYYVVRHTASAFLKSRTCGRKY